MATAAKNKDDDKGDQVSPEVQSRRAMGKTDEPPTPGDNTVPAAEEPPGPPGQDPDSLTRERKTREAAARARGEEVKEAGEKRAEAGESRLSAGGPAGRTATSPGRSTTDKE